MMYMFNFRQPVTVAHLRPHDDRRMPHIPYLYIDVGAYVQYNHQIFEFDDSVCEQRRYQVNEPFIVPFEVGGKAYVYKTGDGHYAWYVGDVDGSIYDQFFVSLRDPHIHIVGALI